MGIRFYCPNGHKLNVKSELAGKIGICPKCQARMTIPTASVRSSSHQSEEKSDASEAANVRENEGEKGSDARLNVQNRTDAASLTSGVAPLNQFLDKGDRAEAALGDVLRRAVDGSAPGGRDGERLDDANEPLRDPRLVWYVRSRDNQQYGPATGDVMAAWINERRIGPQTLVWMPAMKMVWKSTAGPLTATKRQKNWQYGVWITSPPTFWNKTIIRGEQTNDSRIYQSACSQNPDRSRGSGCCIQRRRL